MSRKVKILLGIIVGGMAIFALCTVVALALFLQPTNARDNSDPSKQHQMVTISLEVGGLAPIPSRAKHLTAKTEGNMFTRSFRVAFDADHSTIRKWLSDSPGIRKAKLVKEGRCSKYILNPRKGYQHAEAVVDSHNNTVKLSVAGS